MTLALVIGGTGCIGQAIVRRFAQQGTNVLFTYLRRETSAKTLAMECGGFHASVRHAHLDVRNDREITTFFRDVDLTELKTVVFAASSSTWRPLGDSQRKHWDWVFEINARGLFLLMSRALKPLARTSGSFLAMTSIESRRVLPHTGLFGAARAAAETVVRYAAVEAGQEGVRFNAICHGPIALKSLQAIPESTQVFERIAASTPLGRLVEPNDIAEVATWLSSESASMITGQVIVVDGGWELNGPSIT